MFTGGFEEIAFVLFIAFLLFGPKKLPEIARVLGKGLADLRRASSELRFSLEDEIRNLDRREDGPREEKPLNPLAELRATSRELMSTLEEEIRNLEHSGSAKKEPERLAEATYVHHDSEPAPPKLES